MAPRSRLPLEIENGKLTGKALGRGVEESQLARLRAPAGPDAGAKTPGEIALVAIVAVLALLRGRGQGPVNAGQVNIGEER